MTEFNDDKRLLRVNPVYLIEKYYNHVETAFWHTIRTSNLKQKLPSEEVEDLKQGVLTGLLYNKLQSMQLNYRGHNDKGLLCSFKTYLCFIAMKMSKKLAFQYLKSLKHIPIKESHAHSFNTRDSIEVKMSIEHELNVLVSALKTFGNKSATIILILKFLSGTYINPEEILPYLRICSNKDNESSKIAEMLNVNVNEGIEKKYDIILKHLPFLNLNNSARAIQTDSLRRRIDRIINNLTEIMNTTSDSWRYDKDKLLSLLHYYFEKNA